ncbi:MAG: hypothetical protein ACE5OW_00480 [Candidatus Bathyarchaeia archaeon]
MRIRKRNEINLSRSEIFAAILGVFILLMAAVKETVDILRLF